MKKWTIVLMLLIAGVAGAQQRPQCTEKGWYKDPAGGPRFATPGVDVGGVVPNGLGAHTRGIKDEDGIIYWMFDQCRNLPGETHCNSWPGIYRKPDHPGTALTYWNHFMIDVENGQPPPGFELRLYHDGDPTLFHYPSGVQHYDTIYIDQITPPAQRDTQKRAYGCTMPPVTPPHTTATPGRTQPPTPTRHSTPPPVGCCDPVGHGCPGGVPPCTKPSPTAVKTASPTIPPPTRTSMPPAPVTSTVTATATMVPTAGASPTVAPPPPGTPSGTPPTPSPTPGKGCGGKDGLLVGTLVALAGVGAYRGQKKKSSTTSVNQ